DRGGVRAALGDHAVEIGTVRGHHGRPPRRGGSGGRRGTGNGPGGGGRRGGTGLGGGGGRGGRGRARRLARGEGEPAHLAELPGPWGPALRAGLPRGLGRGRHRGGGGWPRRCGRRCGRGPVHAHAADVTEIRAGRVVAAGTGRHAASLISWSGPSWSCGGPRQSRRRG